MYWVIVSQQCCDSFRWTLKRFSHTCNCIHSPPNSLSSRLPYNTEQSSLCYTVGPYWLPILNTAVCTCPSPTVLMQPLFLLIAPYLFCPFLNPHSTFWVESYSIYACVLLLSLHILCLRFCMEMHAFSSLPFSKCWAIFQCISKIRF